MFTTAGKTRSTTSDMLATPRSALGIGAGGTDGKIGDGAGGTGALCRSASNRSRTPRCSSYLTNVKPATPNATLAVIAENTDANRELLPICSSLEEGLIMVIGEA